MPDAKPKPAQNAAGAFEFTNPAHFASFLLTCIAEPVFARGSPVFERLLNKVYIRQGGSPSVHVRAVADRRTFDLLHQMAAANGGRVGRLEDLKNTYVQTDVNGFLRRIRLQPTPCVLAAQDTLLLALWNCDPPLLRKTLLHLNELSASSCQVAFVRRDDPLLPTHILRIQDVTHVDAVLQWIRDQKGQAELFLPHRRGQSRASLSSQTGAESRFYVAARFAYPLAGIEDLYETDSDLVLLRMAPDGERSQWLAFLPDEVHFFRKFHEVLSVDVATEEAPLRPIADDPEVARVPIELALARDADEAPMNVWQLDKTIDKLRQRLNDLERRRARVAAGKSYDVYFAYKFLQPGPHQLNPLLIRFLQQRLSTLSNYSYAYCEAASGTPFHLLVAERPQRDLGFGIQLADAIYEQPEEYRRWGVNLYLPVGCRLLPAITTTDAIPLLAEVIDKAESRDVSAVLWDDLGQGRIAETRVVETQPLLSQFRLLNSFQRVEARQIAEQTRRSLAEGLREAHRQVAVTCQDLEKEILIYVARRCDEVESGYRELQDRLTKADAEIAQLEPQIQQVADFVASIPKRWADFVQAVLDLHHGLTRDRLAAYDALRREVQISHDELRAAASRHKDLSAKIAAYEADVKGEQEDLHQENEKAKTIEQDIQAIHAKLYALFLQIRKAYDQLAERLEAIAAAQRRCDQIQQRIDRVDQQEREVQERLTRLEALEGQIESRQAKMSERQAEAQVKEADAASKLAEVAEAEQTTIERIRNAARRLAQLEDTLKRIVAESDLTEELFRAMQQEASMLELRTQVVERWQAQASQWSNYLRTEYHKLGEQARDARAKAGPE